MRLCGTGRNNSNVIAAIGVDDNENPSFCSHTDGGESLLCRIRLIVLDRDRVDIIKYWDRFGHTDTVLQMIQPGFAPSVPLELHQSIVCTYCAYSGLSDAFFNTRKLFTDMSVLDPAEVRVLGVLIEKEATTPEYYPLSLNALVNGCNQKSNRYPVVTFDEDVVNSAADRLRARGFATRIIGNGRVTKFAQRVSEALNLGRRELAILCTLLLRGPQTLGEIKDRSERMYQFSDLEETALVLDKLAEWPGGALASKLPKQPGQKEMRYAHLLAGEPEIDAQPAPTTAVSGAVDELAALHQDVQELRTELHDLKKRFEDLESQLR